MAEVDPKDSVARAVTVGVEPTVGPTTAMNASPPVGLRRTETALFESSPASVPIDVLVEEEGLPGIGSTVGNYILKKKLGEGAHGAVYLAHRVGLDEQRVALKIIPCTPDRLGLVRQELVTLATIVHPNIVQLSDHGVEATYAWFTMPFYEGRPLDKHLSERFARNETLSVEEAYDIFQPLAGALAALHDAGFRHQDIKPENIFLAKFADREHPILLDLGVAIGKGNQKFLAGTREYFAPEQLDAFLHGLRIKLLTKAPALTEAMDVYGLAATLLLALSGTTNVPGARLLTAEVAELPLEQAWQEIAAAQALRETVPISPSAMRTVHGGARREIAAAFRRWFARDPKDRPSARAMATELHVLRAPRLQRERRRGLLMRVALGAAVLLLIGAPVAYAGGRQAVTLNECEAKVAADTKQSGQASQTLSGCTSQVQSLLKDDRACEASLAQATAARTNLEKELGGKLSLCSDADKTLQSLLSGCQIEREGALGKSRECAASLAKSEDTASACATARDSAQRDLSKCGGDLARSTGDLVTCRSAATKCGADEAKSAGDLTKCNADLAKATGQDTDCAGKLSTCRTILQGAQGDLATCKAGAPAACPGELATCTTSLSTCSTSLAGCGASLATCHAKR